MDELNLDYDNNLVADAEMFGQQIAQGDAEKLPEGKDMPQSRFDTLEEALHIAQEVYGETNSAHSGMFHQWVQAILEGGVDVKATEEMLTLLHSDKESFGGRLSWKRSAGGKEDDVLRLRARRHASICAMNVVHAVLNRFRGKSYTIWIQRALWRAVQAEKDIKSEK